MALSSSRTVILLPLLSALVAAAVLWGGYHLARQERLERIARDEAPVAAFTAELQKRLASLENDYERHLARISRTDLNHHFGVQDAIDGLVGVLQISTLNPEGKIDLYLTASEVERPLELPIAVFDPRELPPARERYALITPTDLFGGDDSESGWIDTPEGLYYFQRVSIRRAVLLLIDCGTVDGTLASSLAPWIGDAFAGSTVEGADIVTRGEKALASRGTAPVAPPDSVRALATRFGEWQVRSWDPRRTIVTHRRDVLAGAGGLASLIFVSGSITALFLHRTLRLAEQRVSFVNRVSHELKTPLTNILLNADLAADGATPAVRKRLAMVQEETRRLARLIDNVLAFSKKREAGHREQVRPLVLGPALERIAEAFRPSLARHGVEIEIECAGTVVVRIDPDDLSQILGNLLSNIEKYASSGGLARIRVEDRGARVAIEVTDAGPGIPARESERVFRPFYRLDDRTNEGASGTGLGLSIAKDLAYRAGGSLRLLPGGPGATFELLLPSAAEARVIDFPESRAS